MLQSAADVLESRVDSLAGPREREYMSLVCHQLRAPLTTVCEALHTLHQSGENLGKCDSDLLLELAMSSGDYLSRLVANLLSGTSTLNARESSLSDLVNVALQAVQRAVQIADHKLIKLVPCYPSNPVHLDIDEVKIGECFANLINNAIAYSPNSSTIEIRLLAINERILFEVRDSGMGVPLTQREFLFIKNFRASNARKSQPAGTGLGLYIVKNIARAHGGDVYYRPRKKGSVFGMWLPLTITRSKS